MRWRNDKQEMQIILYGTPNLEQTKEKKRMFDKYRNKSFQLIFNLLWFCCLHMY